MLLCVLINYALREEPTRDLGVSRAGRSLPGLRGSPARRRDAPEGCRDPAVRGHRAGRTRFRSRPSGTQVIPSGRPHTRSFSRAGSLRARPPCPLHPRLSRPLPSPSRGDTGSGSGCPCPGLAEPRLSPLSFRNTASLRLRFPRAEPPTRGSPGQRRLGSLPVEKRAGTANTGFEGRRGCGGSGETPAGPAPSVPPSGLKTLVRELCVPSPPVSEQPAEDARGQFLGSPAGAGSGQLPPTRFPLSLFCGPFPNPPFAPSTHPVS